MCEPIREEEKVLKASTISNGEPPVLATPRETAPQQKKNFLAINRSNAKNKGAR